MTRKEAENRIGAITNQQYKIEQVARATEAMNWPTKGALAEWIWRSVSSGVNADWDFRAFLSRQWGYIPFVGYPLSRSGKLPRLSRKEVENELEVNPFCSLGD